MDNNWIVENLENALLTWNDKLSEMWFLLTESPQTFKGGTIWQTIVTIHGGIQAIGYSKVIVYEKTNLENLCLLDCSSRSGRRTLWMADAKRCQSLQRNRRAAAIVSAEHCVPHRLGNFVCPHGCWGRADLSGSGVQCPVTQPAAVSCAVGVQFLLEHHFLQFAGIWICFPLADRVVDLDPADDFVLPEGG